MTADEEHVSFVWETCDGFTPARTTWEMAYLCDLVGGNNELNESFVAIEIAAGLDEEAGEIQAAEVNDVDHFRQVKLVSQVLQPRESSLKQDAGESVPYCPNAYDRVCKSWARRGWLLLLLLVLWLATAGALVAAVRQYVQAANQRGEAREILNEVMPDYLRLKILSLPPDVQQMPLPIKPRRREA